MDGLDGRCTADEAEPIRQEDFGFGLDEDLAAEEADARLHAAHAVLLSVFVLSHEIECMYGGGKTPRYKTRSSENRGRYAARGSRRGSGC
jgi:hypothetical protein